MSQLNHAAFRRAPEQEIERAYSEYTIGWICAVEPEMVAARAMLEKIHESLPAIQGDTNSYLYGSIGGHNVVVASLPSGTYGTNAAARVATQMRRSFPWLRVALMVGVGGGVPKHTPEQTIDIRLGDVVISDPGAHSSGVIQYDMGKTKEGQPRPQPTGVINKPPEFIRNVVAKLKGKHRLHSTPLANHLAGLLLKYDTLDPEFAYQGSENDVLFQAGYKHPEGDLSCLHCDTALAVDRPIRKTPSPRIFYGTIASGNQVVKDSVTRDYWQERQGVICFEMEAAGLDDFPCLIVRGICDYADSHKNKRWQGYAAAVAAAYAKDLLVELAPTVVEAAERPMESKKAKWARETAQVAAQLAKVASDQLSQLMASFDLENIHHDLAWFTNTSAYHSRLNHIPDLSPDSMGFADTYTGRFIWYPTHHSPDFGAKFALLQSAKSRKVLYMDCSQSLIATAVNIQSTMNTMSRSPWVDHVLCSLLGQALASQYDTDTSLSAFLESKFSPELSNSRSRNAESTSELTQVLEALSSALSNTSDGATVIVFDRVNDKASRDLMELYRTLELMVNLLMRKAGADVRIVISGSASASVLRAFGTLKTVKDDTELQECIKSLEFEQMDRRRERIASAEGGTTHWLWSHSAYIDWINAPSGFLWIEGKPGSGKSVLAKSIQIKLQSDKEKAVARTESSHSFLAVSAWYFSVKDRLMSHEMMFRSLLCQLLQNDVAVFEHVRHFYRKRSSSPSFRDWAWSTAEIKECLLAIAKSHLRDHQICCIIDGLDESDVGSDQDPTSRWDTLNFLRTLATSGLAIKLIILSRPAEDIERSLRYGHHIVLQDANKADVRRIVEAGLELLDAAIKRDDSSMDTYLDADPVRATRPPMRNRPIFKSLASKAPTPNIAAQESTPRIEGPRSTIPSAGARASPPRRIEGREREELDHVRGYLLTNARGVILWVKTVLKALERRARKPFCSFQDIREELTSLPKDIVELYEDITTKLHQSLDEESLSLARRALIWVTVATESRPLQLQELFDALLMEATKSETNNVNEPNPWLAVDSWRSFQRELGMICGPFIEIIRPSDKLNENLASQIDPMHNDEVQLLHQTVKDFLELSSSAKSFSITYSAAKSTVEWDCLQYINNALPPRPESCAPLPVSKQSSMAASVERVVGYLDTKMLLPFILNNMPKLCSRIPPIFLNVFQETARPQPLKGIRKHRLEALKYQSPNITVNEWEEPLWNFDEEEEIRFTEERGDAETFSRARDDVSNTIERYFWFACSKGCTVAIESLLSLNYLRLVEESAASWAAWRRDEVPIISGTLLAAIEYQLLPQVQKLVWYIAVRGLAILNRPHYPQGGMLFLNHFMRAAANTGNEEVALTVIGYQDEDEKLRLLHYIRSKPAEHVRTLVSDDPDAADEEAVVEAIETVCQFWGKSPRSGDERNDWFKTEQGRQHIIKMLDRQSHSDLCDKMLGLLQDTARSTFRIRSMHPDYFFKDLTPEDSLEAQLPSKETPSMETEIKPQAPVRPPAQDGQASLYDYYLAASASGLRLLSSNPSAGDAMSLMESGLRGASRGPRSSSRRDWVPGDPADT